MDPTVFRIPTGAGNHFSTAYPRRSLTVLPLRSSRRSLLAPNPHAMIPVGPVDPFFHVRIGGVAVADSHSWQVDIAVDSTLEFTLRTDLPDEWTRRVVQSALDGALPDGPPGQVSVLLTGDSTVRRLNRRYRGLDENTDVLSFSSEFPGHWEGPGDPPADGLADSPHLDGFILPPGQPAPLGEVIISCPQAQRQAEEKGCGYSQELALLLVHGVLHLAGYDHLEEQEAREMQSLERKALAQVFPVPAVRP